MSDSDLNHLVMATIRNWCDQGMTFDEANRALNDLTEYVGCMLNEEAKHIPLSQGMLRLQEEIAKMEAEEAETDVLPPLSLN